MKYFDVILKSYRFINFPKISRGKIKIDKFFYFYIQSRNDCIRSCGTETILSDR